MCKKLKEEMKTWKNPNLGGVPMCTNVKNGVAPSMVDRGRTPPN